MVLRADTAEVLLWKRFDTYLAGVDKRAFLSLSLSLFVRLSLSVSLSHSVCLSSLFLFLSVCLCMSLSVSLSFFLSLVPFISSDPPHPSYASLCKLVHICFVIIDFSPFHAIITS